MDHRDSLRVAFEQAGFPTPPPERIAELKATIARALAPHATGLLIDLELGARPLRWGPRAVRIVVPLEAQGYSDVASGRVTTFLPGFSPALARTLGAAGCKLLLPYRPDHEASAARQDEVVREAVAGCHARGPAADPRADRLPLPDETPDAFAAAFPSLVVASAPRLQALAPDILKLQFPRDDRGDEADWCKQLDAVCGPTPWVLLGGGGAAEVFTATCASPARGRIRLHRRPDALDRRDRQRRRRGDLASPGRRAAAPLPARDRAERPAVARARRSAAAPPRDWFA